MTRLLSWLSGLDTTGKAIMALVAVGLLAIGAATAWHLVDSLRGVAEQKGAIVERAATQGKVIENVAKAKAAAAQYRADPAVRNADCLRDATNPGEC